MGGGGGEEKRRDQESGFRFEDNGSASRELSSRARVSFFFSFSLETVTAYSRCLSMMDLINAHARGGDKI